MGNVLIYSWASYPILLIRMSKAFWPLITSLISSVFKNPMVILHLIFHLSSHTSDAIYQFNLLKISFSINSYKIDLSSSPPPPYARLFSLIFPLHSPSLPSLTECAYLVSVLCRDPYIVFDSFNYKIYASDSTHI